jgi:hypothetical protein
MEMKMSAQVIGFSEKTLKVTRGIGYGLSALLFINGLSLWLSLFVAGSGAVLSYALFSNAMPLVFAIPSLALLGYVFYYLFSVIGVNRSGKRFAKLLRTPEGVISEINGVFEQAKSAPSAVKNALEDIKQSFDVEKLSKKDIKAQCLKIKSKKEDIQTMMALTAENSSAATGLFDAIEALSSGMRTHLIVTVLSGLSLMWLFCVTSYLAL